MYPDVHNVCGPEFFIRLAFLSVEDDHVLYDAMILQRYVNPLVSHSRFGQLREPLGPEFIEAKGFHISGIVTGPVTVPSGSPVTKITSTPPPGWL
jgi:hypothetical protein